MNHLPRATKLVCLKKPVDFHPQLFRDPGRARLVHIDAEYLVVSKSSTTAVTGLRQFSHRFIQTAAGASIHSIYLLAVIDEYGPFQDLDKFTL